MVAAGSITVAVRVRPPTAWEASRLPQTIFDNCIRGDGALSTPGRVTNTSALRDIVQIVDDRVLTFDPNEKDPSRAFIERGFVPPGTKRYKDRRFIFDRVFGHSARQEDVYCNTAKPLLGNFFDGYNATIFAYGATGCGKTHTISGTDTDPGIIYLTMADLFQEIEDRKEDHIVDVVVTFLEIYNEEIRDLLAEPGIPTARGGLQIREDKTVKVVGLAELRPKSAEEVKQIVLLGNSRRTQSPTHANETSSRSHAVLQVHVTQSPRTADLTEQRTMATLSIIDLAGSERAAATTNMGQRMVEGANINKSLLALGNCINALCESGGASRHVPYRNSKLTRLLKFSLGGNCKTVMIVCVAPTSAHFDDTHNTLVYAERATKIKTKVVTRNVVNVDRHVGQYVEAINRLNLEVAELKAKLSGKRNTEVEKERRRRKDAVLEIERGKNDMQAKADQMQPSIVDGATCASKIVVAEMKLRVIRARIAQIDSHTPLTPDLEAERGLLQALAGPEEQVIKADSMLNARVQRSNNSNALFDATLRAVSERRSDKLDEMSLDNVKVDAKWRKAEMERIKAEAAQGALRDAVTTQAEAMVNLIGIVSRCTVILGDSSRVLQAAAEEGRDGMEGSVKSLAASLKNVAEGNDTAFQALLGFSVSAYAMQSEVPGASLNSFKGYSPALGLDRAVSNPISSQTKVKPTRRSSSFGSSVTSPRRAHKSPRKSWRSSLVPAAAPYRRVVSDNNKGKKKGVQWKDEVGQGGLDDGGENPANVVISVTNACPLPSPSAAPAVASSSSEPAPLQQTPVGGSESEWEDEKTEESFNTSFTSVPPRESSGTSTASLPLRHTSTKRARPSRLGTNFLQSKSRGSTLGRLAEDDEDNVPATPTKKSAPLGDRNMNRIPSPTEESTSSTSSSVLHIPKGRDRSANSPARRVPTTPKIVGMSSKSGRRRSAIGPLRNERQRRRSSMIPQLSPKERDDEGNTSQMNGPRRVPLSSDKSPVRRTKRMSLLAASMTARPASSLRLKTPDPNMSSGDLSFRGLKPTWR